MHGYELCRLMRDAMVYDDEFLLYIFPFCSFLLFGVFGV
jgi:hypothetical protein